MFNSIKRIIGLGWQNLARDGGIAVANVFIIMIPILLTSALFLLKDVSDFLVKDLQGRADISIFFNESVSRDNIAKAEESIRGIQGVTSVEHISKDDALKLFIELHKDDAALIDSLQEINDNPFLPVLHVNAISTAQYEQVAALLDGGEYKDMVYKINYGERKDAIERIFSFTSGAQRVGLILFVILGAISVMVTFNTVRMAILSRGVEIGIQRLVGASRWFIRGQFVIEGLIFGLLGAVFSLFVAVIVCWYLNPAVAVLIPGMNLWQNFTSSIWTLFGLQLAIGAGLGVFSSMIAITRHLKV